MSVLLKIVGTVWALIGILGLYQLFSGSIPSSPTSSAFSVMFNGLLFILPGLGLAGLGEMVSRRK